MCDVLAGDCVVISELMNKGFSSIEKDSDGWCPIHYAAWLEVTASYDVFYDGQR